jgi:hypothetical protein
MQIEEIFEVEKEGEKESFNDLGNKMLLWYVQFSCGFFYCTVNLLGMDLG